MSRLVGNPTICICENKDADQLRGNREADQRLCFRYTDSIIPLLSKSKISNLEPSSVLVQPGLCRTCSETTFLVFPRGSSNYCDRSADFSVSSKISNKGLQGNCLFDPQMLCPNASNKCPDSV